MSAVNGYFDIRQLNSSFTSIHSPFATPTQKQTGNGSLHVDTAVNRRRYAARNRVVDVRTRRQSAHSLFLVRRHQIVRGSATGAVRVHLNAHHTDVRLPNAHVQLVFGVFLHDNSHYKNAPTCMHFNVRDVLKGEK